MEALLETVGIQLSSYIVEERTRVLTKKQTFTVGIFLVNRKVIKESVIGYGLPHTSVVVGRRANTYFWIREIARVIQCVPV